MRLSSRHAEREQHIPELGVGISVAAVPSAARPLRVVDVRITAGVHA
jgi:hypothetical protein